MDGKHVWHQGNVHAPPNLILCMHRPVHAQRALALWLQSLRAEFASPSAREKSALCVLACTQLAHLRMPATYVAMHMASMRTHSLLLRTRRAPALPTRAPAVALGWRPWASRQTRALTSWRSSCSRACVRRPPAQAWTSLWLSSASKCRGGGLHGAGVWWCTCHAPGAECRVPAGLLSLPPLCATRQQR